jgi:hypothetical protein
VSNRIHEIAFKVFDEVDPGEPGTYIQLNVDKFAECLLKECMELNNQFVGRRIGEIDLDLVYKEHFGVK